MDPTMHNDPKMERLVQGCRRGVVPAIFGVMAVVPGGGHAANLVNVMVQ